MEVDINMTIYSSKNKRLLIILIVLSCIIILGIILYFIFQTHISLYLEIRSLSKNHPWLSIEPKYETFLPSNSEHEQYIESPGYIFNSPWGEPLEIKKLETSSESNSSLYIFKQGRVAFMGQDSLSDYGIGNEELIKKVYGENFLEDKFQFLQKVLEITPQDVKLFSNLDVMKAQYALLLEKTRFLTGRNLIIFETPFNKGLLTIPILEKEEPDQICIYLVEPNNISGYPDIIIPQRDNITDEQIKQFVSSLRSIDEGFGN